ncbi:MAG: FecR domain-containing protein [Gammaproteobacteria bacterium]|nr:FecR domain-containing protein [Gammaproteobacteria bacterium]
MLDYTPWPLVIILSFYLSIADARAPESIGKIFIAIGDVQVVNATGTAQTGHKGMELRQGDRIITARGALAQIKLTDGSRLSVRSDTVMGFDKYRFDRRGRNSSFFVSLLRGGFRSISGLIASINPNAYRVATPTATIGIRGTDHEPMYIPPPQPGEVPMGKPGTYDKVNAGRTFIRTPRGILNLMPGQIGFVPPNIKVAPKILPKVPAFYRAQVTRGGGKGKPRSKDRSVAKKRKPGTGIRSAGDGFKAMPSTTTLERTTTTLVPTKSTLDPSTSTLVPPKSTLYPSTTPLDRASTTPVPITRLPTTTTLSPITTRLPPTTTLSPITTRLPSTTTKLPPITTRLPPTTTLSPITTRLPSTTTRLPSTTTTPSPTTTQLPTRLPTIRRP